jgi:hypothetical protein
MALTNTLILTIMVMNTTMNTITTTITVIAKRILILTNTSAPPRVR